MSIGLLGLLTGCTVTGNANGSASYNTSTGAWTIGFGGGIVVGKTAKSGTSPNAIMTVFGDVTPTTSSLVFVLPIGVALSNDQAVVTLVATTDTGYTSSIAVPVTASPIGSTQANSTSYAYTVPDSIDLQNWESQVDANTTNTATIGVQTAVAAVATGTAPSYPVQITATTPMGDSNVVTVNLSGNATPPSGPSGNCPTRGNCLEPGSGGSN
jgi:hypothetical protein